MPAVRPDVRSTRAEASADCGHLFLRCLMVCERCEIAFDVQSRSTSGAGGGDGLAVGVVDDVAAGEDAGDVGAGRAALDFDVSGVVEVQPGR